MKSVKFLTTLIPSKEYDVVRSKSTHTMSDAASALQWHIYEGLSCHFPEKIQIINVMPIYSYPQYYSDPFIKRESFEEKENVHINVGFCNVKLLRKISMTHQIYKELMKAFSDVEEGILFVYTIGDVFIQAVEKFKKKKKITVCAIIADLPEMSDLSSAKGKVEKLWNAVAAHKSYRYLKCIDAYVLLTEYMADYLHIKNKPYCVMEGIATDPVEYKNVQVEGKKDSEKRVILYTGTLHEKFGILTLIEAFQQIEMKNYELQICGMGDCEEKVKEAEKKDPRIKFYGQISRKQILELQAGATVLVNPRQNVEEFTKYSFPSKIMEYLSSGIPVIAYKLDGIPKEYDEVILYVEGNEAIRLKEKMIEVCEMSEKERKEIGNKGKEFVWKEKNSIKQTKKIVDMVQNIL